MESAILKAEFTQPAGFKEAQFSNEDDPDSVLGQLESDATQLWLIQAPNDVDMTEFDGLKVVLSDEHARCKMEETGREFEVIVKPNDESHKSTGNSRVLLNVDDTAKELTPVVKHIAGHLSIVDNIPIPEMDLPTNTFIKNSIPEGLRQRFVPFGAVYLKDCKISDDSIRVKSKKHKKSKSMKISPDDCEIENVPIETKREDASTPTRTSSSRKRRRSERSLMTSVESNDDDVVVDEDITAASSPRKSARKRKAAEPMIEEVQVDDVETPKKRRNHARSEHISEVVIKMEADSPTTSDSTVRKSRRSRH